MSKSPSPVRSDATFTTATAKGSSAPHSEANRKSISLKSGDDNRHIFLNDSLENEPSCYSVADKAVGIGTLDADISLEPSECVSDIEYEELGDLEYEEQVECEYEEEGEFEGEFESMGPMNVESPFPFGNNNVEEHFKAEDAVEISVVPALTFETETCTCSQDCIQWWKCRSIQCGKCREQSLAPRPPQTGGGYGQKRKNEGNENGNCAKGNFPNFKVVSGLCSFCMQGEAMVDEDHREVHHMEGKRTSGSSRQPKYKPLLTEYKSAYRWPGMSNCQNIQKDRDMTYDDLYRMQKLYDRPPWNYCTIVPPPPPYESLGCTEAKIQELDVMLAQPQHTDIKSVPLKISQEPATPLQLNKSKPTTTVERIADDDSKSYSEE